MANTYWQKQTPDKPLFPDLLWSRPEQKATAGKLLIVGGNLHSFNVPASTYNEALKTGVGMARVLLPESLKKTVGQIFEVGEYAPSTPSGSFSIRAIDQLIDLGNWADGTLFAGDFGRNSETAILLEKFAKKYTSQLTLSNDSIDYFLNNPGQILNRENTTLVLTFAQLQKISSSMHFTKAFTSNMDLMQVVEGLHEFSLSVSANIILVHDKIALVAVKGKVSTTKFDDKQDLIATSAFISVWWLQNPNQPFEALTTAIHEVSQ